MPYSIPGNFCVAKFLQKINGDFNNFVKKIFRNDPRGQHKRYSMAILSQNLISRLSEIREIRENKATQNFPVYSIIFIERINFGVLAHGLKGY